MNAEEPKSSNPILLGRYEVEREIGRGGGGRVLLVRDLLQGGRRVALKRLLADAGDSAQEQALRHEFRLLSSLSHPHIEVVHDFGRLDEKTFYFTCDVINGGHIDEACRAAPWSTVVALMQQLFSVLAYLHDADVVHLDIKPGNILVTGEGEAQKVTLIDLGVARHRRKQAARIDATPRYAPPELIRGEQVDERADLYSAGVVLYELLTGRAPFESDRVGELLEMHLHARPTPPRQIRPEIPPLLEEIILRLLAKDVEERFQTAWEVIEALSTAAGRKVPMHDALFRGRAARFVGRERELQQLEQLATGSHGAVIVIIVAPAGVGKSRLLREYRAQVQLKGIRCLLGSCHEGSTTAFGPWAALCAQVVADCEADPAVAELPAKWAARLGSLLPTLVDRYGITALPPLPPAGERLRQFDAIAGFLLDVAARTSLVLEIEDMHWADDASVEMLAYLARMLQALPEVAQHRALTMVVSSRPDEEPVRILARLRATGASRILREVPLPLLDIAAVRELVRSMLGAVDELDAAVGWLFERTKGHAFLLLEVLRELVDEGALRFVKGRWRLDLGRVTQLGVPRSIQAVLGRRLDRLSAAATSLLSLLALVDEPLAVTVLEPLLARLGLPTISSTLAEDLRGRGFLTVDRAGRYALVHASLRDVVTARLAETEKQRLHAVIAETLEREAPTELDTEEIAARHYLAAGDVERAYGLVLSRADRLRSLQLSAEARTLYDGLLVLLPPADPRVRTVALRAALVAESLGDFAAARVRYEALLADRSCTNEEFGRAYLGLSRVHLARSEFRDAEACATQAEEAFQHLGDLDVLAGCLQLLGAAHRDAGKIQQARQLLRRAVETARASGHGATLASALHELGRLEYAETLYADAEVSLAEARAAAMAAADQRITSACDYLLALILYRRGRYRDAYGLLSRARATARSLGDMKLLVEVQTLLGAVMATLGQRAAAIDIQKETLVAASGIGDRATAAQCQMRLGWEYVKTISLRALRWSRQAAKYSTEHEVRREISVSHFVYASAAAEAGDLSTADANMTRAYEASERMAELRDRFLAMYGAAVIADLRSAPDAIERFATMLHAAETSNWLRYAHWAPARALRLHLLRGEIPLALASADMMIAHCKRDSALDMLPLGYAEAADTVLLGGELPFARALAQRALVLALRTSSLGEEACARVVCADLDMANGAFLDALRHMRAAEGLHTKNRSFPYFRARCLRKHGAILESLGERDEAERRYRVIDQIAVKTRYCISEAALAILGRARIARRKGRPLAAEQFITKAKALRAEGWEVAAETAIEEAFAAITRRDFAAADRAFAQAREALRPIHIAHPVYRRLLCAEAERAILPNAPSAWLDGWANDAAASIAQPAYPLQRIALACALAAWHRRAHRFVDALCALEIACSASRTSCAGLPEVSATQIMQSPPLRRLAIEIKRLEKIVNRNQ